MCAIVGFLSGAAAHSGSVRAGGRPKRERAIFTTGGGGSVPAWPTSGGAAKHERESNILLSYLKFSYR